MATIHARLKNQNKFKCFTIFSANFYEVIEEGQRSNEIELIINLNINNHLAENDILKIDIKSQIEHQIQIQGTKESDWIFDKKQCNENKIL